MAFSTSNRHWLRLVITMICIFLCTCKFGKAYENPDSGAAGVVAEDYGPPQGEDEGETYENYPKSGGVGHDPELLLDKAIQCFNDKHIYSSCEEPYRLTEHGYLHVPPQYTDEYCHGPCVKETNHLLDCIAGIFEHFVFYNKATLKDIQETIEEGCSYGPKRGNFDVVEHIQADEAITNKISNALLLVILGWNLLF